MMTKKRKRIKTLLIWAAAFAFVFAVALVIYRIEFPSSRVSNAKINLGSSEVFSKQDIADAAQLVLDQVKDFDSCDLLKLSYSGDNHSNRPDDLEWLNDLKSKGGGNFTQCIRFDSEEEWLADTGAQFKGDRDYFQFWLAREEGGEWKLLAWGY